jgi:DNA-binding LacI/PurR family transcriptional regulator
LPATELEPEGVIGRRMRGYRTALANDAIVLADDRVMVGPASVEGGANAFELAWSRGIRPTAVLAMSDAMAIGAMRAIRGRGLRVPDDISVVGFDDIDIATHTDPPLTTIHQPIRQKGEEAIRLLLSVVHERDAAQPEHRRLETRLVVRGSTAPAPRIART